MMENLDSSLQNVHKQDARRICTLSKLYEVSARRVYIWVSCIVAFSSVVHLHIVVCSCVWMHRDMVCTGQDLYIASLVSHFPGWPCKASVSSFLKLWGPEVKDHTLYLCLPGIASAEPSLSTPARLKSNQLRGSAWESSESAGRWTGDSSTCC